MAVTPHVGEGDSFVLATKVVCTVVWLSARNSLHTCGEEQRIYSHCVEGYLPGKLEWPWGLLGNLGLEWKWSDGAQPGLALPP